MAGKCFTCGKEDAPARCSRCLIIWFCDADCQRAGWKTHKPDCRAPATVKDGFRDLPLVTRPSLESQKQLQWARGEDAERLLLWPSSVSTEIEKNIERYFKSRQPLDAMGEALRWQITSPEPERQRAKELVELLSGRFGLEPVPREKHDYSLLHADPPKNMPVAPPAQPMIPFSVHDGQTGDGLYPEICRRHSAALLGSRCPVVDAKGGLSEETMKLLKPFMDVRNPRPCIIRNLPLFQQAVDKWDVEYLAEHMGEQLYHTFAADQDVRRFAYFFDSRNEAAYECPPIAEACKMTFRDFMRKMRNKEEQKAYYLQTPVLQYKDGVITCARFDEHMENDLHTIDNHMMNQLAELGSFGPITRNQLFVSFSDFLTAAHYDQQHNLYLQIRGSKRFLLFDASDMAAMCTYPTHHPLDRKARIDLEQPDLDAFPRGRALAGRGVEALLEQGDILFMPMSWFHHVHSLGPENVSLNFWFVDSGVLFLPSKVLWPLSPASIIELSRHVEYFVAEQIGPVNVGAFVEWWLGGASQPVDELILNRWRYTRNYILRRLAVHSEQVASRVLAMLDPRRWEGLKQIPSIQIKAVEGLRAEHRITELMEGLSELRLSIFRENMPGSVYRILGRALDVLPREKLRLYLESSEEVLCLVRDNTDWNAPHRDTPADVSAGFLFGLEEANKIPSLILRGLEEISALALAPRVKVTTVDNGLFANWLQFLDAGFFSCSTSSLEPDWVLTGSEREFNYGSQGEDVFHGLFQPIEDSDPRKDSEINSDPFVVHHRFNLLFVNVFRGYFLRGPNATRRRRLYAATAKKILRPCDEAVRACEEALSSVARRPGQCLVGIHKRVDNPGTARMQFEQTLVSTEAYIEAVRQLAIRRKISENDIIVVLATDDIKAEAEFRKRFGCRLVCRSVRRSFGGINEDRMPVEVHGQKERLSVVDARDCLVDALLLAACDVLVHADSNVTIAAGIMNPESEAVHVRALVPDARSGGAWPGYRRCKLPV